MYFTLPKLHRRLVIASIILTFLYYIFYYIFFWILPSFLYSLAFLFAVWSESDKIILLIGYFIHDIPFFLEDLSIIFQQFYIIFSSDNYLPLFADSCLGSSLAPASQGSVGMEGGALAVDTLLASNTAGKDSGWQPVPASERLENYSGMHNWKENNPNEDHPTLRQFDKYKTEFTKNFSVRGCIKNNTLVLTMLKWSEEIHALNYDRHATEGHKLAVYTTQLSIKNFLDWKDETKD